MSCHGGFHFPWKSFGGLRFSSRWPFCVVGGPRKDSYHGQSLEATCHCGLMIVARAKGMGSPWIFFLIVRLLVPYGMFSWVNLDYLGLCLDE
jgi:hypothetical protein